MSNNIIENIVSIEMCPMVVDSSTTYNYLLIQTHRNKYCFKLSETSSLEEQFNMFRLFASDLNTPFEQPKQEEQVTPQPDKGVVVEPHKEEKHDGAKLLDVPPSAPTDCEITTPYGCATQD